MAETSAHFSGVQETEQVLTGIPPRTNDFDPGLCELEFIQKRYSWYPACDVGGVGPHPGLSTSSSVLVQRNASMAAIVPSVAYLVVIKNKKTKELWNCVITTDSNRTSLHINGGSFKIKARTNPPTLVTSSSIDVNGKPLRQHEGVISIFMAVHQSYMCTISLMDSAENELSFVMTEEEGAMLGFQQAVRGFPLAKTRLEGVEGSKRGRQVIHHFADLVNNGLYDQFRQDFGLLKDYVDRNPKYQDLIPRIKLEECVIDLVQSNWVECEEKARDAIAKARQLHSPNISILLAIMKYRIGTVKRLQGDLNGAWELMNEANELLFFVAPCEAVAEFFHHLFSLYADERTTSSGVNRQGYDEAENCCRLALYNWQRYCESFPMICSPLDFEVRLAVRLMNFYLKTSRDSAPSLDGRQSAFDVAKAEEVAQQIERKPLADCSKRVIASHHLTKSDILLLKGDYNDAIKAVRTSLQISRRLGLKKYIEGGKQRLTRLCPWTGSDIQDNQNIEADRLVPSQGSNLVYLLEAFPRQYSSPIAQESCSS